MMNIFGPISGFSFALIFLFITLVIAVIVLKYYALWYSARGNQRMWFIIMLVVNTIGILEIIYLIWFRPKDDSVIQDTDKDTATKAITPSQDDSQPE